MAGRPLMFSTPHALEDALETYFESTPREEWTVTGLALALGTSRQVLVDYAERDGYAELVNRAKLRVENAYEISLRKHGRSGDIFALKNFGWKDKTEQDINANVTGQLSWARYEKPDDPTGV